MLPIAREITPGLNGSTARRSRRTGTAVEPDDRDLAASLSNLGLSMLSQNRLREAREIFGESLALQERLDGKGHPNCVGTLINLALVSRASGDMLAARSLLERAIAIERPSPAGKGERLAAAMHNLAATYYELGQHGKAEKLFREVLEMPGQSRSERAATLTYVARYELMRGNLDQAQTLFEDALEIRTQALGWNHPKTATLLSDVAQVYSIQGRSPSPKRLSRAPSRRSSNLPGVTLRF